MLIEELFRNVSNVHLSCDAVVLENCVLFAILVVDLLRYLVLWCLFHLDATHVSLIRVRGLKLFVVKKSIEVERPRIDNARVLV